ncbi:MAG: FAD-dependent oxidoreductase [Bryobacteraceae bacterium]|nr:FAD-dependent oxidoreductase [Bryobacteraceae bacterium]
MRKNGASEGAVELLSVGFNALLGDGPGTYSALMMLYGDMFTNNHTVRLQIVDGNDKFPAAFANKLGDRIAYNSPVISIGQDPDKVWVTVDNGGTQQQVTGDYLICTLPFTVLRDIPVSPPFSEEKQCAIRTLKYTSAVRICLQFSEAFWLKEGLYGLAVTDLPMMIAYPQPNQAPPGGILNVLSTGASARQLAALEESVRLETVLCQISEFFPQARALYVGGVTKDWDSDPYSRGGYAYFEKGQVIPLTRAIEFSERRICFAGDHASFLSGWMEGALNSGLRAAATVGSSASGASQAGYLTPVNIHSIA